MVDVAEMNIKGTMNTTAIDSGLRRVGQGMNKFGGQTKSALGSVGLLSSIVGTLATGLITVGTAGIAAFSALASKAPAVAPALAKIEIGMMKISHTAGRLLAPIFETIANELIPAIGSAINILSPQIEEFASGVSDSISGLSGALSDFDPKKLVVFSTFALAGAAAGFAIGGWAGAFIGLALGAYLGGRILSNIGDVQSQSEIDQEQLNKNVDLYNQYAEQTGQAGINPNIVGGSAKYVEAMQELIWYIFGRASEKEQAYTEPNSVSGG